MATLIRGIKVLTDALRHPLGSRRKIATLLAIFRWQVASRLAQGPVDAPWVGGARLLVERGMTGATGNVYFGLHEVPDMAFVAHFLRPEDTLFDIGANIGSYALLAASAAGARVVAFEPHPGTAVSLERNIAHNGLGERITVCQVALSDRVGRGALTDSLDTMNHLVPEAGGDAGLGSRDVVLETLDCQAELWRPTMLKIDVEGHEASVLGGGVASLADPTLLAIEIETVTAEIDRTLRDAGFHERFYDPFTRQLREHPVTGLVAANRLYLRDPIAAQARVTAAPPLAVGSIVL